MTTVERRALGISTKQYRKISRWLHIICSQTGNGRRPLIDSDGNVVHEWHMPQDRGRDAVLLPNGNLGYNGNHNTSVDPSHGIYGTVDILWRQIKTVILFGNTKIHAHHDAQWLTDGLLYVAATDYIDGRYTDIVKRVDLKGNVLWEYNCAEHLYEIEFPYTQECPIIIGQ